MLCTLRSAAAFALAWMALVAVPSETRAEMADVAAPDAQAALGRVPELIGALEIEQARALLAGLAPEGLSTPQRQVRDFSLGLLDFLEADCAAALPRLESARVAADVEPRTRALGLWALGACYLRQAQPERALHLLARAGADGYRASPRQLWSVASDFALHGRPREALAYAEKAAGAGDPLEADQLRFLAQLYRQTGRAADAVAALERLVALTQDRFDRIALGRAVEAAALEARIDR